MEKTPTSARSRKTSRSVAERGQTTTTIQTRPARPHHRRQLTLAVSTGHGIPSFPLATLPVILETTPITRAIDSRQRHPD